MIDPVRPIALEDIEAARERIVGTVLRTPLVKLDLGRDGPDIWLKLENLQPTNAYKIRGAANAVAQLSDEERARGRLDDQRRQCRAGRRLCGAGGGHSLLGRGDRDRAADQARADAGARRDDRPGFLRAGMEGGRGACVRGHRRDLRPSVRQSRLHRRPWDDGAGDHRGCAGRADGHRCHRRRRADHRRRKRGQGAASPTSGCSAREPETAAPYALSLREGGPSKFPDWQA